MLKKIVGIVLIVLCAGAWLYLDYLNKQELQAAEQIRQEMMQARAQAQAKALARGKFEATILAELGTCQANAEKAKSDYITANSKPVRKKPGQFTVPQTVQDEAARILATGNADCQQAYNARMQKGL
jgi:hypothetical protein